MSLRHRVPRDNTVTLQAPGRPRPYTVDCCGDKETRPAIAHRGKTEDMRPAAGVLSPQLGPPLYFWALSAESPSALSGRSISCTTAMGAVSPARRPTFRIRR